MIHSPLSTTTDITEWQHLSDSDRALTDGLMCTVVQRCAVVQCLELVMMTFMTDTWHNQDDTVHSGGGGG